MEATLSRWGNSLAVRIPRAVVEARGWREGDVLSLADAQDGIVMRKAVRVSVPPLSKIIRRFQAVAEEPLVDWGGSVGREEW